MWEWFNLYCRGLGRRPVLPFLYCTSSRQVQPAMLFKQQCQGEADSTCQCLSSVLPSSALCSREPNVLTAGHSSRPCFSLLGPALPPTWQEWACHICIPCAQDEVTHALGYIHRKYVEISCRKSFSWSPPAPSLSTQMLAHLSWPSSMTCHHPNNTTISPRWAVSPGAPNILPCQLQGCQSHSAKILLCSKHLRSHLAVTEGPHPAPLHSGTWVILPPSCLLEDGWCPPGCLHCLHYLEMATGSVGRYYHHLGCITYHQHSFKEQLDLHCCCAFIISFMSILNAHKYNQVTAFLHSCHWIQPFLKDDTQKKWQQLRLKVVSCWNNRQILQQKEIPAEGVKYDPSDANLGAFWVAFFLGSKESAWTFV